jgi:recombination protein RecA
MREKLKELLRLRSPALRSGAALRGGPAEWSLASLSGRLAELSGDGESAALTLAFGLVREAQLRGQPAAFVAPLTETFFPPDAAAGGVDLDALAVVRTPDPGRAATHLLRSGAFGLVVLDLGAARLGTALQARLLGLAQKHRAAVLFLTRKAAEEPSLGSLVSLRGAASRRREGWDRFACEVTILKDKRREPGWRHREVCRGPDGLH